VLAETERSLQQFINFGLPVLLHINAVLNFMAYLVTTIHTRIGAQYYRMRVKSFPDYKHYYKKTTVRGIQTFFF